MSSISDRIGYCPICKTARHHAFLVVENLKESQKVGIVCDECKSLNASATRDRKTLEVIDRYARHGFFSNNERIRKVSLIKRIIGGTHG